MARPKNLRPFRALRYDTRRAGPLADLVAPPHDVIAPELRERLLAASPYNVVRLIRPETADEAVDALEAWRRDGILVREETPAAWLLEEGFVGPDGAPRTRRGIVARIRLERYGEGDVVPHERTFPRQKSTRLELLRATRTKLSPVLLLHEGPPPAEPPAREADLGVDWEGVTSRLWRIADPDALLDALARVRGRIIIADGHHRYETALRFHEEDGSDETGYVLAVLVSRDDPGLVIFPTHRLAGAPVPDLNGRFRVTSLPGGADEALARLALVPRDRPAFVVLRDGDVLLAESDPGPGPVDVLDTAVLDELGLDQVGFTASAAEAEQAVRTGRAAAAFLVRAPTIEQVEAVVAAGEKMPEKSTYFFPKLTSGLLFSPFDE